MNERLAAAVVVRLAIKCWRPAWAVAVLLVSAVVMCPALAETVDAWRDRDSDLRTAFGIGDLEDEAPDGTPDIKRRDAVTPADTALDDRSASSTEPPTIIPATIFTPSSFSGGAPITLDLDRVPLRDALQAFARFTGVNIVSNDAIKTEVSLHLNAVPWRQAFTVLLDAHALGMREEGNVIWVAPATELHKRAQLWRDARTRATEAAPLSSRLYELRYQRADDIHQMLRSGNQTPFLSKRGAVSADVRSNRLFVTDVPERLDQIAAMIAAFDQPARQVMIEARIVEADEGFGRNLGFRLGTSGGGVNPRIGAPDGRFFDLPAAGFTGVDAASATLSLFKIGADRLISLELSALEADGRGKVLSNPRVVTTDRSMATIEQGTELPYQAKVRSGVSGLQFRRASLKLAVTPHITPDRRVSLDVEVSKDTIGAETAAGASIDTKHIKTQVEVDDGGTVAIGGILATTQREDRVGVPYLHRIPFLGALFRRSTVSERKTELLVFITPTVIDAAAPNGTDAATGWRMPGASWDTPPRAGHG